MVQHLFFRHKTDHKIPSHLEFSLITGRLRRLLEEVSLKLFGGEGGLRGAVLRLNELIILVIIR